MRKIFLTVLLVAFASAAFAEGTPKKPSVAGFVSNGFWDNWEVSAGFGTGTAFSNGGNSGSWGDRFGFEGNLSVTKWVHPVFGMRAQLQGGWFNNFDSQIGKMTWPYMFGHLDFMVNASNWIGGYRADRAWYAVPFAGFGYMASNFTDRSQRENASGSRQDFAFTAGLLSKFRCRPHSISISNSRGCSPSRAFACGDERFLSGRTFRYGWYHLPLQPAWLGARRSGLYGRRHPRFPECSGCGQFRPRSRPVGECGSGQQTEGCRGRGRRR